MGSFRRDTQKNLGKYQYIDLTAWYSLFLNQHVFQENKICNYEIYLSSFSNTKETNDSIFLNKTRENFNLTKIFWNVKVRL